MKKFISVFLAAVIVFSFAACANKKGGDNDNDISHNEGMINPVRQITADEAASLLNLEEIDIEDGYVLKKCEEIDGKMKIYSFDVENGKNEYNVRLVRCYDVEYGEEIEDISGIYLDGKISSAIYDSVDELAPSVEVRKDKDNIVASSYWNTYLMSVSSQNSMTLDDMQKVFVDLAKMLIETDNILNHFTTVVNPYSEIDFKDAIKELGAPSMNVNSLDFKNYECEDVKKIIGDNTIYSFEYENGDVDYEVRIVKNTKISLEELSGVYFGTDVTKKEYSKQDDITPAIETVCEPGNAVAFVSMNGYSMSVYAENMNNDNIYKACVDFAIMFLVPAIVN